MQNAFHPLQVRNVTQKNNITITELDFLPYWLENVHQVLTDNDPKADHWLCAICDKKIPHELFRRHIGEHIKTHLPVNVCVFYG